MDLIIGGAYQNKKEFVKNTLAPCGRWVDGAECDLDDISNIAVLDHFHLFLARILREERDPEVILAALLQQNPDICIISNELGYGVVPIDAFDRRWREFTGRQCTKMASRANHVYRVVCGIGTQLK